MGFLVTMETQRSLVVGVDFGNETCRIVYGRSGLERWSALDHYGQPEYPSLVCRDVERGQWMTGRSAASAFAGSGPVAVYDTLRSRLSMPDPGDEWRDAASRLFFRIRDELMQSTKAPRVAASTLAIPLNATPQERSRLLQVLDFPEMSTISEPEAALLGYHVDERLRRGERLIAVFQLGTDSCSCTILRLRGLLGIHRTEVLALVRSDRISGEVLDTKLWDCLLQEPDVRHHLEALPSDRRRFAEREMVVGIRQLKYALLSGETPRASITFARLGNMEVTLQREWLVEPIEELVSRAAEVIDRALLDAQVPASRIDEVLPVGGMTRIPAVTNMLRMRLQLAEPSPAAGEDPEVLCLARGAARHAYQQARPDQARKFLVLERPGFGIRLADGTFDLLIPENAAPPFQRGKTYVISDPAGPVELCIYSGFTTSLRANRLLGTLSYDPRKLTSVASKPLSQTVRLEMRLTKSHLSVAVGPPPDEGDWESSRETRTFAIHPNGPTGVVHPSVSSLH